MKSANNFLRAGGLFASVMALAFPALGTSLPEPLAQATMGELQCYSPDISRKTCTSLSAYKIGKNDTIDNITVVLISNSPAITMEIVSPVEIKAEEVCGMIRKQDIDRAKFAIDGRLLDPQQAVPLRQKAQTAMKDFLDHEICTAYVADDEALLAKVKMDETPMPPDMRVIWVSPADGYKVSP